MSWFVSELSRYESNYCADSSSSPNFRRSVLNKLIRDVLQICI